MTFKGFLRTIVFLAILFVVLYAGMNNTQPIEFHFPLAFPGAVRSAAALIYFAMFAVGVLGGTLLHSGGGGKSRGSKEK